MPRYITVAVRDGCRGADVYDQAAWNGWTVVSDSDAYSATIGPREPEPVQHIANWYWHLNDRETDGAEQDRLADACYDAGCDATEVVLFSLSR